MSLPTEVSALRTAKKKSGNEKRARGKLLPSPGLGHSMHMSRVAPHASPLVQQHSAFVRLPLRGSVHTPISFSGRLRLLLRVSFRRKPS